MALVYISKVLLSSISSLAIVLQVLYTVEIYFVLSVLLENNHSLNMSQNIGLYGLTTFSIYRQLFLYR